MTMIPFPASDPVSWLDMDHHESLESLLIASTVKIKCGSVTGTGFFVAPNTILTCAHVMQERTCSVEWGDRQATGSVRLRLPDSDGPASGPYPAPDLAVVDVAGADGHPYVEIDPESPIAGPAGDALWAAGFSERYARDKWSVTQAAFSASGVENYDGQELIRVTGPSPIVPGMSGGPVLNTRTGWVCGVLKRTADDRVPTGGWVVPLRPLIDREPALTSLAGPSGRWRATRRQAFGSALRHSLSIPKEDRPAILEDEGPAWPLRPEFRVVPFHGREETHSGLVQWCERDSPIALRLITGQGGTGKTRLALELVGDRLTHNWIAGLLSPQVANGARDQLQQFVEQFERIGESTLVVIDYAEGLSDLPELLDRLGEVTLRPGQRLRLLLLARHPGEWWRSFLPGKLANRRIRNLIERQENVTQLASLSDTVRDQVLEFRLALKAFADALRLPSVPEAMLEPTDDQPPVLQVHAAALLAAHRARDEPGKAHTVQVNMKIFDQLLNHESVFWSRSSTVSKLPLLPTTQRQVVATSVLVGADDADSGADLLRRVFEMRKTESIDVAAWLSELYPVRDSDESRYWAPLRPDVVGERLVATVFSASPGLAEAALAGLPEDGLSRAFTVLTRACVHSEAEARMLLNRLLRADMPVRLPVAIQLAPKAGHPLGEIITTLVRETDPPPELIETLAEALPDVASAELLPLVAYVIEYAVAESEKLDLDEEQLALMHQIYGNQLLMTGRITESLEQLRQAFTGFERLYEHDPGEYIEPLSYTLSILGLALANAEQAEEAAAMCARAIELAGELDELPVASVAAQISAAETMQAVGRLSEAEQILDQALPVIAEAATEDPDARGLLATTTAAKAMIMANLGRYTAAQAAVQEARFLIDPLAAEDADRFAFEHARVRAVEAVLAVLFQDPARHDVVESAIKLLRHMAHQGFGVLNSDLVLLLSCLASMEFEAGDVAKARRFSEEAAEVAQSQAATGHQRMAKLLVHVLASQAEMRARLPGFLGAVIPQAQELAAETDEPPSGRDLAQRLAAETQRLVDSAPDNPSGTIIALYSSAKAAFAEDDLIGAITLGRRAHQLFAEGHAAGALDDILLWPEVMTSLAEWLTADEQYEEARDLTELAVQHQERLFENDRTPAHARPLVWYLVTLGDTESRLGHPTAGLRAYTRAGELAREMVETGAESFEGMLLRAMSRQSDALHQLGQDEEAVSLLRQLYARHRDRPEVLLGRDPELLTKTLVDLARLHVAGHQPNEAAASLASMIETESAGLTEGASLALVIPLFELAQIQLDLGRADEAVRDAARAVALADQVADEHPELAARARYLHGEALRQAGADAREPLARALASYRHLAETAPLYQAPALEVLTALASAELDLREWDAALSHIGELIEFYARRAAESPGQYSSPLASWHVRRAEAYAGRGDLAGALTDGRDGIKIYRRDKEDQPGLQRALAVHASHLLRAGDTIAALNAANEAEALSHRLVRADPSAHAIGLVLVIRSRAAILTAMDRQADAAEAEQAARAAALKYDLTTEQIGRAMASIDVGS